MQLVVGVIVRPHGVRGEVVVDVTTDEPAARFVVGTALATDPPDAGPLTIEAVRPHQGRLLVVFEGVADRNEAQLLRGVKLCVDSADIPESEDPDEFSDYQLIGLAAVDRDGQRLGEVVRIQHGPAADLLILRLPEGREALVPFVKAIVPEVDLAAGRVVLTPPGGLLEL
jgi:16S rRNA processing protein RimM